jgi:hypothetical protein
MGGALCSQLHYTAKSWDCNHRLVTEILQSRIHSAPPLRQFSSWTASSKTFPFCPFEVTFNNFNEFCRYLLIPQPTKVLEAQETQLTKTPAYFRKPSVTRRLGWSASESYPLSLSVPL